MAADLAQSGRIPTPGPILLVEDDPKDIELAKAAFELCEVRNEVIVARDGVEALKYLNDPVHAEPVVMMLDLKLPKLDGLDVLRWVRRDTRLGKIPVVVFTASRERRDQLECYENGASAYVVKPVEFIEYLNAISGLSKFWAAGTPIRQAI